MSFATVSACRSCGGTTLLPVLDLGEQPLANALRRPDDAGPEWRFPLAVVACASCSLAQLTGTVDPAILFDRYHYFSSFSTTMTRAMGGLAGRVVEREGLGPADLVVEVASNDGYLLRHYVERDVPVLGVDPAANVAAVAVEAGVPTLVEYFGADVARRIVKERGGARVVHANNVMGHVPDINDFMEGVALLLADDGVAVIETPHVVRLVAATEFDTIYHEHVFYWSLTAAQHLARRHGLVVADVEELPVHGGSLRLWLRPGGVPGPAVERLVVEEAALGVGGPAYYADFAGRVARLCGRLVELLDGLAARGRSLAAYGAAAKGTVLLNHVGIGADRVAFVADRNVHKHGLLVPGVHLPITGPERLLTDRPDDVLLLTWNFADEIIDQQAAYLDAGGCFVVPVPEPRLITR